MNNKVMFLATCHAHPEGNSDLMQLAEDARADGWVCRVEPWQAIRADVAAGAAVLPLCAWDYSLYPQQYRDWLNELHTVGAHIYNPPAVQQWNMDKRYLCTLAKGLPITPSIALLPGQDWGAAIDASTWDNPVCKPLIGQSGRGVRRLDQTLPTAEEYPDGALLQPFIPASGEVCLIYIAGQYSHAVLRRFSTGEWRGNAAYGASIEAIAAKPKWCDTAAAVLNALPRHSPLLYARIDGLLGEDKQFWINEIELIEPALYTAQQPQAHRKLLAAIQRDMG